MPGMWSRVERTTAPMAARLYRRHASDAAWLGLVVCSINGDAAAHLAGRYCAQRALVVAAVVAALAGLALGIASIIPTIVSIAVFDHYFGQWLDNGSLRGEILGQFLSTGPREELLKLLLVVPLLPWLLRQTPALWLAAGSLVGLGFAMEENISYFAGSSGSALGGRVLTANFLHLALTGMTTYGLCSIIKHPRTHLESGLTIILIAILAHGAYNALFSVPDGGDFFSMMILALIAKWYFLCTCAAKAQAGWPASAAWGCSASALQRRRRLAVFY